MHKDKGILKFITCGSVDDGKSTLIGHMLYDAKLLFVDQKRALELDSKVGSCDGNIDYSLLLDGLIAEREQGITIDVAYRYFSTEKRSFVVADTPGHEQYTRNMAVGASFADLAIILIDATKGVLVQTRRHAHICAMMGINHIVFAVNKMDLANYDKDIFNAIKDDVYALIGNMSFISVYLIPVSATVGDNIISVSPKMSWYKGLALLPYLEQVDVAEYNNGDDAIVPVQRVVRPNADFRGYQGQVESGILKVGEKVSVYPSKEESTVKRIFVSDKECLEAYNGEAVTIQLNDEIDISRGCVIVQGDKVLLSDMFLATLLWMDDKILVAGRSYLMKLGTKIVPATVVRIKHKININTGEKIAANQVEKNDFAVCEIILADKIALAEFTKMKALGGLILIDSITNMTSACGVVMHTLRRGNNISWQKLDISRTLRAEKLNQTPCTIWFTGLSGSGKSTIANALEKKLFIMGNNTMVLDGDNIRHGLNCNLGFTKADRVENIRRIGEVAKLMNDAGLIVLTAFISPYKEDRQKARQIIGEGSFIEVYVNTPLEECERRDVKGLYKKVRLGEIPNFTGISDGYEEPENPEVVLDTLELEIDECVNRIIDYMRSKNIL